VSELNQPPELDGPAPTYRRRMLVLGICCLSLFIVAVDQTIVNIALPAIRHDLHASVSGLQWTIDGYALVLASLLIFAGSTADRLGRRRVFQVGLATFSVGSLLCSLAPNIGLLVASRVVQAVGGSMLNPVAMSIITNVFTERRERARAIGVWASVVGLSFALGPTLGGLLVESVGWRSIFWINLPVGLAALVLTALFVPESRAARPRRPDPVGQLLVLVMLAGLTYAIIEGPVAGWTSPAILGCFALSGVALAGLLRFEPRRDEPLLDLRFFRSAPFTGATVIAVTQFAGLGGFLFLNTLYLQEVRGLSPLRAGLLTLPLAGAISVAAPLSGRLVGRRGPRLPLLIGGLGMALGAALLAISGAGTGLGWLALGYLPFGFGFGLINPPVTNTAVSGMPLSQAGVAAAIASTSRQAGQSFGVAVLGSVVTSAIRGPSGGGAGDALRAGFVTAARPGWWITAGCGLLVAALGLLSTGRWARGTAAAVAGRLRTDPSPDQPPDPAA
jgi:EmrB/QacA subfamily drug resistance transporter